MIKGSIELELDPSLNRLPEKIKTIHLIGICGTGMGSLAGMLQEKGYQVTGSDDKVYPPMSDFLARLGIPVLKGYRPENLDRRPDLVIVGNAVTRRNPESPRLKEMGLPYLSFPQALRLFFLQGKKPLVAAGTHGKTTTSALAVCALDAAGLDPGFMIGGILSNYGQGFRLGRGEWFVVEGDEYDTAFFDKVPKFVHYAPFLGILTSIEFDHADIYPDLNAVQDAFRRFAALLPADGLLVAHGDDPLVRETAGLAASPVIYYGLSRKNDWRAVNLKPDGRRMTFDLVSPGREPVTVFSPLPGVHNVLNTLAAAAALDFIGLPPERLPALLGGFAGVRRRLEVRGVIHGITILDDFAHHPTAVRETIAAARGAYPGARLAAVFEPRTNTSRRNIFQQDYALAFDGADEVLVREPPDLIKIKEDERFSSMKLVEDLKKRGLKARYFPDTDSILAHLLKSAAAGDVILVMSNGGFNGLHGSLLEGLSNQR